MSIARTSLLALSLVVLSSIVIAADNPFARWDKTNTPTVQPTAPATSAFETKASSQPVVSTAASVGESPRAKLEYFSASAVETEIPEVAAVSSETQKKSQETTTGVVVERLQVKNPVSGFVREQVLPPQPNLPSAAASLEDSAAANSGVIPPDAGVFTATFAEDTDTSVIQQTSGQLDNASDGTLNPFAEFREVAPEQSRDLTEFEAEPQFSDPLPPASTFESDVQTFDAAFAPPGPSHRTDSTFQNPTTASSSTGPQTPSVTVRWKHPSEFNVGQECRCDLIVENTGVTDVQSVVTEAVLPSGLEVVSAQPAPAAADGRASWNLGDLKSGEARTIELVVVPRGQGNVELNAYVRLTGASTASIAVLEPKVRLTVDGPKSVEVGQLVNYTANITNPGSGQARNVVIQAVIPDGLEHRRGKMLTIDIGTLNPGESRRARLSLAGVKGGEQKLAVRVVADGGLTDQIIEPVAVAEPQLNIGVTGPEQCVASQANSFEVIVANEGKVESNNVRAKYKVPAGFDFVNADRGGKFNTSEQTIDWFVGTLEPGQMKQFNVSLRPSASGEFRHQVGVISEHGKMTMAEHASAVLGHAKLTMSLVSNSPQVASSGGEAAFEIVVENKGGIVAEGVGVSCEVPPGLTLVDVAGPSKFVADSGVIIFRALPTLAAGESARFVIRTKCTRSGDHVARVRVASQSISRALIDEAMVSGVSR